MRANRPLSLAVAGALIAAGGFAPALAAKNRVLGRATLLDSTGEVRGNVRLTGDGTSVVLKLTVKRLPPGQHGVHLHALGSCNAPDFASAGPHLNPQMRMHGSLNPQGPHIGDLPNLSVGSGGNGTLIARLTGTQAELWPALFDGDGSAIVVHAAVDDYRTDPSGNSGNRIACGVIIRG